MDVYSNVYNKSKIYDTLFMKIFTVTEYPNVDEFKKNDPNKYEVWINNNEETDDKAYEQLALTPEYAKIVGVTLCTVSENDDGFKRNFQKLYDGDNESYVLNELLVLLETGIINLSKKPLLCGHNLLGYDIPFIIKRLLKHNIAIPSILKDAINSKPWESPILDTATLWKFNGYGYTSLNEIATFLSLKYKTLPMDEYLMNYKYWTESNQDQDWYEKEFANKVNLTLQLMVKLRNNM